MIIGLMTIAGLAILCFLQWKVYDSLDTVVDRLTDVEGDIEEIWNISGNSPND